MPTETKTISLRLAKATKEDFAAFDIIFGILDDIDSDRFPRDVDGQFKTEDEDYFEIEDEAHCRTALRRMIAVMQKNPGALLRVAFMAHAAMSNDVFDPAKDHLGWHPELQEAVNERQRRKVRNWARKSLPLLERIDWQRRDGYCFNDGFSGYAHAPYCEDEALGWVLRYKEGSDDITKPEVPPAQCLEPLRIENDQGSGWYWVNYNMEVPEDD